MSLLIDLHNLCIRLHFRPSPRPFGLEITTNVFLFLPLSACWKKCCPLRKYTCTLPQVFHPCSPPITWYIRFALEKWTLSRNSQLWFFVSSFPCLTCGVKTGNASCLATERYLQSSLCDPFGCRKVLRASGWGKKTNGTSDGNDAKGQVKSKEMAVANFLALLCPPLLGIFILIL